MTHSAIPVPKNQKCSEALEIKVKNELSDQQLSGQYTDAYYKVFLKKPMALKVYGISSDETSDYLSMSMRPSETSDSAGTCDNDVGVPFLRQSKYQSISSKLEEAKKVLWETGGAIQLLVVILGWCPRAPLGCQRMVVHPRSFRPQTKK